MSYYYCNDCCETFSEEDAKCRKPVLEDGVPPWQMVMVCPICGSDEIEEAGVCERCGQPIPPDEHLCDACEGDLYGAVESIIESYKGDVADAKDKFVDYLERVWL